MADPIVEPPSWQALEYIADLVRGITIAAGCRTDLGLGQIVLDEEEVREGSAPGHVTFIEAQAFDVTAASHARTTSEIDVLLEYQLPLDENTPNPKRLSHRARFDLLRALMVRDKELPPFISSITATGGALAVLSDENAGSRTAIAQVTARVGLTETK